MIQSCYRMFGITFALLTLLLTILATIETLELSTCFDEINAIRHIIGQCQTIEMFDKTVKSEIEAGIRSLIALLKVQKKHILIDMLKVYLPVVIPIDMDRLFNCLTTKQNNKFVVETNSRDYKLTVSHSCVFIGMYTALRYSVKQLIKMFRLFDIHYLDSPSDYNLVQLAMNCVQSPCDEYTTLTKQMWAHICISSGSLYSGQNQIAANALWNALMCYILKSAVLSFGGPGFSTLGNDDLSNNAKRAQQLVKTMWDMLRYIIIAINEFNIDCTLSDRTKENMKWVNEAGVGILTNLADKFSDELQSKYKPIQHGMFSIGILYESYQYIIDVYRRGVPGIKPYERVPSRYKRKK